MARTFRLAERGRIDCFAAFLAISYLLFSSSSSSFVFLASSLPPCPPLSPIVDVHRGAGVRSYRSRTLQSVGQVTQTATHEMRWKERTWVGPAVFQR